MFQERLVLSWAPLDRGLPVYLFEMGKAHPPPESSFGEGLARWGSGVEAAVFFIAGGCLTRNNGIVFFLFFLKPMFLCMHVYINVHTY